MCKKGTIDFILKEGEGYKIEFKAAKAKLDREIVAFANASGGSIYLGINDHNQITGVTINNKLKSEITTIAHHCDPSIKVHLVVHSDIRVLEIQVEEGGDKPYRCADGFFLRVGSNSQKLKRDEIIGLISMTGKIHIDEAVNSRFQYPKDFCNDALQKFLDLCGIETKLSTKNILLNLNVAKEQEKQLLLTNTGVLFFAKNPQQFFPEAYITVVKYQSKDRFSILGKKDFKGNLIEQIEEAMMFVMHYVIAAFNITHPSIGGASMARREEIYEYPPVALREAIVNAVTHRDYYYDRSHIYIHMYSDRIEIENPGGLLSGLTIDDLGKSSARRNGLIADLFDRAGYVERVGSGFARMQKALAENDNPELKVSATNFFNICFYRTSIQHKISRLTLRQSDLYEFINERGVMTTAEAAKLLHISHDTARRELQFLLDAGMLEKQGKGKATAYKFKYQPVWIYTR